MPANVGIVPPPPGVVADFDYSNPWLYTTNMSLIGVGLAMSFICLVLRVYTKTKIMNIFGWEDNNYHYSGVGIHTWNVTAEMFSAYQKCTLAAAVIYVPALAFAKISLIFLYRRIMEKQPAYRWALRIITGVVIGYSIAIPFALIFGCNPIAKTWDSSITEGSCISSPGLYIATAVTNIVTDLALILLPIPLVLGLQMPAIQKFYLLIVFLIGCATVVTSILRLATLVPFLSVTDFTYELAWPQLWCNVEANLIVICPCLPNMRQFIRHHFPGWMGESTNARGYYTPNSASVSRSRFKSGTSRAPDEIRLTEQGGSTHSRSHIVKEVEWNVTEERTEEDHGAVTNHSHTKSFQYES
ncbi:hypothetical protein N7457_004637 [Penicillium paradoxum]|uniref:uncharacterized protein n=1 Tax=Penicillium paradoxum TaxID=176176 RepID=UPI002546AFAD|nr:uncharacterized protein N7457_004637 [Penicillium paradoxum]KAJ5782863.1 hypothetical protein N7457_004637 [Penicillium paradoxum]